MWGCDILEHVISLSVENLKIIIYLLSQSFIKFVNEIVSNLIINTWNCLKFNN